MYLPSVFQERVADDPVDKDAHGKKQEHPFAEGNHITGTERSDRVMFSPIPVEEHRPEVAGSAAQTAG